MVSSYNNVILKAHILVFEFIYQSCVCVWACFLYGFPSNTNGKNFKCYFLMSAKGKQKPWLEGNEMSETVCCKK